MKTITDMRDPVSEKLRGVAGIYSIINIESGGFYIGSSRNFQQRFRKHRTELINGVHKNSRLMRSFRKRGIDAFCFSIIETVNPTELAKREQSFLGAHAGSELCYNAVLDATRTAGNTFDSETLLKISRGVKRHWMNPDARRRASLIRIGRKNTPEHVSKTARGHDMYYDVISPEGIRHTGVGRASFCREVGLSSVSFHGLIHGKYPKLLGWSLAPHEG